MAEQRLNRGSHLVPATTKSGPRGSRLFWFQSFQLSRFPFHGLIRLHMFLPYVSRRVSFFPRLHLQPLPLDSNDLHLCPLLEKSHRVSPPARLVEQGRIQESNPVPTGTKRGLGSD